MKLKHLLILAVIFFFTSTGSAQEAPELSRLSEHVYAYIGITQASPSANSFGANCGVIIGSDAVMVIDTLVSAKKARALISQIEEITDTPIKYVANTHYHLDHAWGNCEFEKLGAVIIAHENAPLSEEQIEYALTHPEDFGMTAEDLTGTTVSLPRITFRDSMNVDLGGVTVKLHFPGPSHTQDSITAYVNEDNILFTGDAVFNKYHPFLGEGDISSWIKILSELEQSTAAVIVPGHGPAATRQDLRDLADYLEEFDENARRLCDKKTQDDAPAVAEELLKLLPEQGRTEMPVLVEMNLRTKYLPSSPGKTAGTGTH